MADSKPMSWLTMAVSVLSLVIACASFYVSYKAQQLSIAEDLSVTIRPQAENLPVIIRSAAHGGLYPVIVAPFEVTLSNNGNRKLSVVRYEVFEVRRSGGKAWYDDLDGGLMDSKDIPVKLPMVLDIGESTVAYLRIGLMVSGSAMRTLSARLPDGGAIRPGELFRILARSGIDVYGNTVMRETGAPEAYAYEKPYTELRTQRFNVSFQTGKGTVVTRITSWHRSPEP